MKHVVLTANSAWNIANYRAALARALIAQGYRVTVLAGADGYESHLVQMGCKFQNIAIDSKSLSPLADIRLAAAFHSAFRRLRPDMVFGYTIKNNIYGALAARALGIPYIPNVSGLGAAFFGTSLLRRIVIGLYRSAFARVPLAFFQNPDDRALFVRERVVPPERAALLPGSGVDLERFRPKRDLDGRAPHFLLIARMLWDKGIAEFVAAARILRERWPEARFSLLGFADVNNPKAISRGQLDRWQAEGLVDYLGQTDDVRPFIADADCIVLPTYYGEGTPRTLIEAAAMGRPAIASDAPGCREIVIHERTGYLIKVRCEQSLSEAMARFAELDGSGRGELARAAREHAETNYDEKLIVDSYLNLLKG